MLSRKTSLTKSHQISYLDIQYSKLDRPIDWFAILEVKVGILIYPLKVRWGEIVDIIKDGGGGGEGVCCFISFLGVEGDVFRNLPYEPGRENLGMEFAVKL